MEDIYFSRECMPSENIFRIKRTQYRGLAQGYKPLEYSTAEEITALADTLKPHEYRHEKFRGIENGKIEEISDEAAAEEVARKRLGIFRKKIDFRFFSYSKIFIASSKERA